MATEPLEPIDEDEIDFVACSGSRARCRVETDAAPAAYRMKEIEVGVRARERRT